MTKRLRNRVLLIVSVGLFVTAVVAYEYVIPLVVGREYLGVVYSQLKDVDALLDRVASTGNMTMFSDPDLPLADRLSQANTIKGIIDQSRTRLTDFQATTTTLPVLPATGWFTDYLTATVTRRNAERLVLQSREVLDEYETFVTFVVDYTSLQRNLDTHMAIVEDQGDIDTFAGHGADMTATAKQIRDDTDVLKGLAAPPDLQQLQQEAAKTFAQAAQGFDNLATGLNDAIESEITSADDAIVAASLKNKTTDKDLLTSLANKSPIFVRLFELPEKVDYVER